MRSLWRVSAALMFVLALGVVSVVNADPAFRDAGSKIRNDMLSSSRNVARMVPVRTTAPMVATAPVQAQQAPVQQAPAVASVAPAAPAPSAVAQANNSERRGYRSFSYQPQSSGRYGMGRSNSNSRIHLHTRADDKPLGH